MSNDNDLYLGHPLSDNQKLGAEVDISNAVLAVLADAVDDLERNRIATENRIRSLEQAKGVGHTREGEAMRALLDGIRALESRAIKDLERGMRQHPLWEAWGKYQIGVGEKQLARFLASIGNPANRPNVSKLWQYCGHGDPERSKLRKGQQAEFSPEAKKRLWLIVKSCLRQKHSPWYARYEEVKARSQEKVHKRACRNTVRPVAGQPTGSNGCGTREHPEWGEPGSPWRKGHIHAHAIRVVGKEILLDLWKTSRNLEGLPATKRFATPIERPLPVADQQEHETQPGFVRPLA